jgi:hypothetical protein
MATAFGHGNYTSYIFYLFLDRENTIMWPRDINAFASHVILESIKHGLKV